MTADAVFARLRRRPFVPFRLTLTSGTTYDIAHPAMLFVSRSGLTVALYDRTQQPTPGRNPHPPGPRLAPARRHDRRLTRPPRTTIRP